MKNIFTGLLLTAAFFWGGAACRSQVADTKDDITIHIVETSDVHGRSLAQAASFVDSLRGLYNDSFILLDGGDILQGMPSNYYFNYIDTLSENVEASARNFLKYDAITVGNHDIETGHSVYDKWIKELQAPVLGANVVNASTGEPYLKPYTILKRKGVKIAVLGMLTPAIPNWLSEELWSGLRFEDIVESSRRWLKIIKKKERPDIVIGLFHSGYEGGITTADYAENEAKAVAERVAGFDLILYGHDHTPRVETLKNPDNKDVICAGPNSGARSVVEAEITLSVGRKPNVSAKIVQMADYKPDTAFVNHFRPQAEAVENFVNRKIGVVPATIKSEDCFFGSAPFTDMVHTLQLSHTGADVSFTAPALSDAVVKKGDLRVSDMFTLYKYENKIHVLTMTGKEIKDYLEMSYGQWANTLSYNRDSAAGLDYEVDASKPVGQRVNILRMSDNRPFDENKAYKVVMNSYRANGGGELLTKGAGIPVAELEKRTIYKSAKDLRYYLMQRIEAAGVVDTSRLNNWKFR